jgi:hypothetical protein
MILETVAVRWAIEEFFKTPNKPGAMASSKFETSGRTSLAGTSTHGSTDWLSWNVVMLK